MTAALERSESAVDEVFVGGVLIGHLQTDNMRFVSVSAVVRLFFRYRFAGTVVVCCEAKLVLVFGEGVQALSGAEAAVGMPGIEELMCVFAVDGAAFGLFVWPVWSSYFRAFIPLQASPSEVFEQALLGICYGPFLIRVFYSQKELATCALRK